MGSVNMQGFDLKNGRLYYYEGQGNANDGTTPSTAWVSALGFDGTLAWREPVAAIADLGHLASLGVTATGFMEPESLKFKDGALYLGFATRNTDDVRRVTVLRYAM